MRTAELQTGGLVPEETVLRRCLANWVTHRRLPVWSREQKAAIIQWKRGGQVHGVCNNTVVVKSHVRETRVQDGLPALFTLAVFSQSTGVRRFLSFTPRVFAVSIMVFSWKIFL